MLASSTESTQCEFLALSENLDRVQHREPQQEGRPDGLNKHEKHAVCMRNM